MWRSLARSAPLRSLNFSRAAPAISIARTFRTSAPALADLPIADLHKLGTEALGARGYGQDDSAILMDAMLWIHLREGGAPRGGLAALASGALAPPVAAGVKSSVGSA